MHMRRPLTVYRVERALSRLIRLSTLDLCERERECVSYIQGHVQGPCTPISSQSAHFGFLFRWGSVEQLMGGPFPVQIFMAVVSAKDEEGHDPGKPVHAVVLVPQRFEPIVVVYHPSWQWDAARDATQSSPDGTRLRYLLHLPNKGGVGRHWKGEHFAAVTNDLIFHTIGPSSPAKPVSSLPLHWP